MTTSDTPEFTDNEVTDETEAATAAPDQSSADTEPTVTETPVTEPVAAEQALAPAADEPASAEAASVEAEPQAPTAAEAVPDPEPAAEQPVAAEATPVAEPAVETAPVAEPAVETAPVAEPTAEEPASETPSTVETSTTDEPAEPAAKAETPATATETAAEPAVAPSAEPQAQTAETPSVDPAAETPTAEIDPDEGLGLPEAGAVLGPPNLGGFESGEIITGTVLTVSKREAEVDLGNGKVGVVGDRHWSSGAQVDLTTVLKTGDSVEAAVLARADLKKRITLSHLWAQQKRGWEAAEAAAKDKSDLQATVTETVKGGLSLDVNGVRAFMPASLVDVQTVNDLKPLIGQTVAVRVIEADRNKARLIVSRKAAMRANQRQEAKAALDGIEVGQVMTGKVAQITDFGAFVDVEGVRGLVHKSEIGWTRARDPQRELKVGQEVEVKVLKVQPSRNRLGLSMRTENDPLTSVRKGERFEATVTRLVDFGAFVALPSGVEGLVHVSEMAEYRVFAPEEIVIPGEKVWVKVLKVDKKRRTIDLSMAQAVEETAANEAAAAAAEARAEQAQATAEAAPAASGDTADDAPTDDAPTEGAPAADASENTGDEVAPAAEDAPPETESATDDAAPANDDNAEDAAETAAASNEEE